jgi:hypothetical protein
MSLIDLIRRPAKTSADLKTKLQQLQQASALQRKPLLENDRRAALLNGDYAAVEKIDGEIRRLEYDEQAREAAIEAGTRELEQPRRRNASRRSSACASWPNRRSARRPTCTRATRNSPTKSSRCWTSSKRAKARSTTTTPSPPRKPC